MEEREREWVMVIEKPPSIDLTWICGHKSVTANGINGLEFTQLLHTMFNSIIFGMRWPHHVRGHCAYFLLSNTNDQHNSWNVSFAEEKINANVVKCVRNGFWTCCNSIFSVILYLIKVTEEMSFLSSPSFQTIRQIFTHK